MLGPGLADYNYPAQFYGQNVHDLPLPRLVPRLTVQETGLSSSLSLCQAATLFLWSDHNALLIERLLFATRIEGCKLATFEEDHARAETTVIVNPATDRRRIEFK